MKYYFIYCVILLTIASCDSFSDINKREINLGNQKLYILNKQWGIGGGGHYKIVISKDRKIDENDFILNDMFSLLYSQKEDKLILYFVASEDSIQEKDSIKVGDIYVKFGVDKNTPKIPKDLKDYIDIKHLKRDIDYFHLVNSIKLKKRKDIVLYEPFSNLEKEK